MSLNTAGQQSGKSVRKPWNRLPGAYKRSSPNEYEQEKTAVVESCLAKINRPGGLVLGKNRQGTLLSLNYITEEDLRSKLISVPLGCDNRSHKTWRNAAMYAMKYLSLYHGHHNVGDLKAWQRLDGTRRPAFDGPIVVSQPFCDNVIFEFSDKKSSKQPITAITEFLNWLGMKRHKRASTTDSEISFHPSLIGKHRIKVSLANVSLLRLEVLRTIMTSGLTERDLCDPLKFNSWCTTLEQSLCNLKSMIAAEVSTDISSILNKLQIQEAFKIKIQEQIKMTEFDLTYDYAGCLDAEEFTRIAEKRGHRVLDHKCGLNCVKLEILRPNLATAIRSRTYNKWYETWQQGFSRSDDIACKSAFALNPSTLELMRMMTNPEVQQHGLTRNELTFLAPAIPSIEHMMKILNKHSKTLLSSALVTASLQDQLSDMESCVKRSILTFWPEIITAKLREHRKESHAPSSAEKEGGNEISRFQPEGGLVRWTNKRTSKYNGVVLRTNLCSRTTDTSSWNGLLNLAALATTCNQSPILFLGVQGHEQFIADSTQAIPSMHCLWFLAINIQRVGEERLKTYLPYFSDFKTENFKNIRTSFLDIGINLDELENIRPACLTSNEPVDYNHIKLDIELSGFCSPSASDPSSIWHEQALSCPKTYVYRGSELKHLPDEFTPWTQCVKRICGPAQKADFQVNGSWFRVPRSQESEILQLIATNPEVVCLVKRRNDLGGLVYQVSGDAMITSSHVPIVIPSNPKASTSMPVQDKPMKIVGARYDGKTLQVALDLQGSFYLPKTILVQLKDRFSGLPDFQSFIARELVGYSVEHYESKAGYVKGNTNKEEFLSILDNSKIQVATNVPCDKRLHEEISSERPYKRACLATT